MRLIRTLREDEVAPDKEVNHFFAVSITDDDTGESPPTIKIQEFIEGESRHINIEPWEWDEIVKVVNKLLGEFNTILGR